MDSVNSSSDVLISLSRDEALVLLDFVSRFTEDDQLTIVDQAEARLLWDMCCVLEKRLDEVVSEEYPELVKEARDRIRDPEF